MNDTELLHAWATQRDETAFAELVRRHLDQVHACARRQVGESPLADEVAQAVFLVLARKAGAIGPRVVLSGWLFRTTRFVAARAQRAEQRRTHHETLAAMQPSSHEPTVLPEHWRAVEPHLDAALAALPATDRDAVLLRYFEDRPLRAVGERLGVNEEAAKKRVSRAVEKLRAWLTGKGVLLSTTGLLTLLGNLPAHSAPAGLAGQITSAATANTASAATAALAQGAMRDWWLAQVRQVLPWAAAALLLLSTGVWGWLPWTESAAPVEVADVSSTTVEPLATAPTVSTAPASLPPEPGPSKILLSVRSAKDNRPLIAQVVAGLGGDRGYLERLDYQTDPEGTLEVPVGHPDIQSLSLWISAPGHVPVVALWKRHEFVESVLLHSCLLEPGEVLAGVVQDEAGLPVTGAQVQFTGPGMNRSDRQQIQYHPRLNPVTTDAQGNFRSDQLPVLRGNQSGMSYTVLHPDFVRARISLSGPESLATNHVVVLERGSWVTGRVVGPEDLPVPGAGLVEVDPYGGPDREAISEVDGSFSLGPFAAGTMQIKVTADGFKNAKERVSVVAGTNGVTLRLTPADGSKTEWEQWKQGMDAAPTVRVAGTAVDAESGEPLPRFHIWLNDHLGGQELLGDGHSGSFDWPVRMAFHRQFSLEVEADGYETASSDIRPVQDGPQTFEFRLERGGHASGRVVDAKGRPIARAVVGLNGLGFGFFVRDHHASSANDAPQALTDSDGRFSIRLKLNTESLLVVHEAGIAQTPVAQAKRATIVLQPWGAIEGVALTAGRPAAGQRLSLHSWMSESDTEPPGATLDHHVTTDAQGRFRFDHVPPGPVALSRTYKFSPSTTSIIGNGPRQRVDVPSGGVAEVTLATAGRALVGRFELSRPIAGYQWRDDLQKLEEVRLDLPPIETAGSPDDRAELAKQFRALNRRRAQIRSFFPDIQPDGSFRMDDVPEGSYTLHLRVSVPPTDPDDEDQRFFRRELGKLELPVVVPAGDFDDPPMDLGTITIPVKQR